MDSKRVDTRISLGVGTIQFIPGDRVSQGDGDAYRLSGQGLDDMPRQTYLSARIGEQPEPLLDALMVATDAITRRWSARQAQAVVGSLTGLTQESIAAGWKPDAITQQAVAQHLPVADVVPHPVPRWVEAGEKGGARWAAMRRGAKRVGKRHSLPHEPVQMWRDGRMFG